MLDLLAELALNSAKATLSRSGSWTIAQKCRQVHDVTVAPFDEHRDVWAVIAASYSALVEARHALVHRRADVDDDTGELVYTDRHDAPQQRVTADEMKAFCYVARRAADAVRSGIITPRHLDDLRWQLDQLQAHHDQHPLGGARFVTPQRFQVSSPMPLTIDEPAPGHLKIDVEALRAQGPSVTHIDLEITCADGTVIHGELEHASKSIIRIDLSDPPKWITEVQPSPLSAT